MMKKVLVSTLVIVAALFISAGSVQASHSWGGYHWARQANPFNLMLGDNVNGTWDSYLNMASSDWSVSTVLDTTVVGGLSGRNCRATNGRVEVCNAKYGFNGWLGLAQIWITGSTHITQGTTKMNDSYFNSGSYNTPAWRAMVMCQEVGHTFGLDHQDENFSNANLGTCMDYTNDPSTNQHPNQHDYDELVTIYSHLDSFTTVGSAAVVNQTRNGLPFQIASGDFDSPSQWGRLVRDNGYVAVFERDFGMGNRLLTHVIWAVGSPRSSHAE